MARHLYVFAAEVWGVVEALRMRSGTRRALQVVGPLLLLVGLGLFLTAGYLMMTNEADLSSDSFMDDQQGAMLREAAFAVPGLLFFGVGGMLTSLGFRKPMAELAATDTEVAVEHLAASAGRGFAREGTLSRGRDIVKVRCGSCGHLESEGAKFCSQCSKRM